MKEFLNTEKDFDFSWLPKEELAIPDSIASEDLQTAIDCFCNEVSDFLVIRCPEYKPQILAALRSGQSFRRIARMPRECSKSMQELARLISNWLCWVFDLQLIIDTGWDRHVPRPWDFTVRLEHPEIFDIPRRIEAMKRLRELWKQVPEDADIKTIERMSGDVDMRDWDEKHLKEAQAA